MKHKILALVLLVALLAFAAGFLAGRFELLRGSCVPGSTITTPGGTYTCVVTVDYQ